MNSAISVPCLLCLAPARCEDHVARRLKHFRCPACTEFVVKYKAELALASADQYIRSQFSAAARSTPAEEVLFIYSRKVPASSSQSLESKYLPIQEALHQ